MANNSNAVNIKQASEMLNIHRNFFRKKFLDTGLIPILSYSSIKRPLMLEKDVEHIKYNRTTITTTSGEMMQARRSILQEVRTLSETGEAKSTIKEYLKTKRVSRKNSNKYLDICIDKKQNKL